MMCAARHNMAPSLVWLSAMHPVEFAAIQTGLDGIPVTVSSLSPAFELVCGGLLVYVMQVGSHTKAGCRCRFYCIIL